MTAFLVVTHQTSLLTRKENMSSIKLDTSQTLLAIAGCALTTEHQLMWFAKLSYKVLASVGSHL